MLWRVMVYNFYFISPRAFISRPGECTEQLFLGILLRTEREQEAVERKTKKINIGKEDIGAGGEAKNIM